MKKKVVASLGLMALSMAVHGMDSVSLKKEKDADSTLQAEQEKPAGHVKNTHEAEINTDSRKEKELHVKAANQESGKAHFDLGRIYSQEGEEGKAHVRDLFVKAARQGHSDC